MGASYVVIGSLRKTDTWFASSETDGPRRGGHQFQVAKGATLRWVVGTAHWADV